MSRHNYFFSVEILKMETFELRLGLIKIFVKIVKTNRDHLDLRFIKTF